MDTGEMAEETSCQRASSSGPSSRPLFSPLHAWRISPESSRPDWNCCSPSWIGTLIFFHVLKKYSVKRFEPLICSPPVMEDLRSRADFWIPIQKWTSSVSPVFNLFFFYPTQTGDPHDHRYHCDPAAPPATNPTSTSCLQRRVPQPSLSTPEHALQCRSVYDPHVCADGQLCPAPAGEGRHRLTALCFLDCL